MLLVRRAHPPGAGQWSIPGGRVEPGETEPAAVAREVREETGLEVAVGRRVGAVERAGPGGVVYAITDYVCTMVGGELRAADDAADVRWAAPEELATLPLVDGLVDALTSWGLLAPPPAPPSRRS
jgi:ADP-ribose pyrophosphatase YjhB (NUDIX family)